ncbi:MAG: 16S rRNA (guanine(527)-N(7))-methyltransferase RsmG, partial [Actinomycetota bacterium]
DQPSSVIDVGSGAGLPGIPLAIALAGSHARKSTSVILVEPKRRAVTFLEQAVRELGLKVEIVAEPAEKVARGRLRESGDAVVARALAPLPVVTELCAPLAAVRGVVIVTAGSTPDSNYALGRLDRLGLEIPRTVSLSRIRNVEQRVHIMRKIGPTSPLYPRRPGLARRRPLW